MKEDLEEMKDLLDKMKKSISKIEFYIEQEIYKQKVMTDFVDSYWEDTSLSKRNFPETDWSMKNFQNWNNNY